jgi:hypothetical protein
MRIPSKLGLLLPFALACAESAPTGPRPSFAEACSPPRPTITVPTTVLSVPKNTNFTQAFGVTNKCTVGMVLDFTGGRTGAVLRVDSLKPLRASLSPGSGIKVFVYARTASTTGSGTVTLTATTDLGDTRTGVRQVTVTN